VAAAVFVFYGLINVLNTLDGINNQGWTSESTAVLAMFSILTAGFIYLCIRLTKIGLKVD
jgi:hypothetical protein